MSEPYQIRHPEVAAWDLELIFERAILDAGLIGKAPMLRAACRRIWTVEALDWAYGVGRFTCEEDVIAYISEKLRARFAWRVDAAEVNSKQFYGAMSYGLVTAPNIATSEPKMHAPILDARMPSRRWWAKPLSWVVRAVLWINMKCKGNR